MNKRDLFAINFLFLFRCLLHQVAAVCEALRQRGLMRNGGDRMMLSCDEQLEALFGTTAFPFHKLEEALAPHVQPADPPVLHATVT